MKFFFFSPQNEYFNNPLGLVAVVQHCLLKEAELVDRQEQISVSGLQLRGREREREREGERERESKRENP